MSTTGIKHALTFTFIGMLTFGGCKDSTTGPATNDTFPASNISYGKYIQPIFTGYCALSGCHDSYSRAGDVCLSTYFDATEQPGVIVAGKSGSSFLYLRISGAVQPVMPPAQYPALSANKIKAIKTWIDEGAKSN